MHAAWEKRLGKDVLKHLLATAKKKGVDPVLVLNVISQESAGNHRATSGVGAKGLMQVMPMHYKACGVSNPFDAKQNLTCGIGILANALKQAGGNHRLALAMYNGEPTWARRMYKQNWPCVRIPSDCGQNREYVKRISQRYESDIKAMREV